MRRRRRRAQALAWLLAAGAALAAPAADAQSIDGVPASRFVEQRETFAPASAPPLDLTFLIASENAAQSARVVAATHATLTLLSAWFGPAPFSALTVAGVGWRPGHEPVSTPGLVTTRLRWLSPARDQATERELIDGFVRQYWGSPQGDFARALIAYTATRATHHQLEGSNFATLRFFGGIVPFSLRSVLLSPPVADSRPRVFRFAEDGPVDTELMRGVRALQTLERFVGWPTLLEAVARMRTAAGPTYDADALARALSEARGTDLRFLVSECFQPDAVFDYAVASLDSKASSSGLIETTVTVVRQGTGLFTTGNRQDDRHAIMPVRVRFADGTEVREFVDGAAPSVSLVYSAKTAAVSATVDPDVMLLLDVNRENNTIVRDARTAPLGIRLALNWMVWLQQAVLSYTAIL